MKKITPKSTPDEIEKNFKSGKSVLTNELKKNLETAAGNTLHGGKRAGSGRKAKEFVKTLLNLTPEARQKLEELAEKEGSLSAAANALLLAK